MPELTDAIPPSIPPSQSPDPHGEAALLLVESLIHELIAREHLSIEAAVGIVQTAIEIQAAAVADRGAGAAARSPAVGLLSKIEATLRIDVDKVAGNLDAGPGPERRAS